MQIQAEVPQHPRKLDRTQNRGNLMIYTTLIGTPLSLKHNITNCRLYPNVQKALFSSPPATPILRSPSLDNALQGHDIMTPFTNFKGDATVSTNLADRSKPVTEAIVPPTPLYPTNRAMKEMNTEIPPTTKSFFKVEAPKASQSIFKSSANSAAPPTITIGKENKVTPPVSFDKPKATEMPPTVAHNKPDISFDVGGKGKFVTITHELTCATETSSSGSSIPPVMNDELDKLAFFLRSQVSIEVHCLFYWYSYLCLN